jgi:hypothetical protein
VTVSRSTVAARRGLVLLSLLGTPVPIVIALGQCLLIFGGPPQPLRVVNDSSVDMTIVECSQDKAPTPLVIPSGERLTFKDWWTTGDDPGFACYVRPRVAGSGERPGCLRLPQHWGAPETVRVSQRHPALSPGRCMRLTNPSL